MSTTQTCTDEVETTTEVETSTLQDVHMESNDQVYAQPLHQGNGNPPPLESQDDNVGEQPPLVDMAQASIHNGSDLSGETFVEQQENVPEEYVSYGIPVNETERSVRFAHDVAIPIYVDNETNIDLANDRTLI